MYNVPLKSFNPDTKTINKGTYPRRLLCCIIESLNGLSQLILSKHSVSLGYAYF